MSLVSLPEPPNDSRNLLNIVGEGLERRHRRRAILLLLLLLLLLRRVPPQLLLQYPKEQILQRLRPQACRVERPVRLDEGIVAQPLRDARPRRLIDALLQDSLVQ